MFRYWFGLILCCCIGIKAFAQQPVARHVTRLDGLPTNKIYSVLKDKDGFMWLGTERGLIRYDGNSFVTYTHPEMNGIAVSDVKQDGLGRIWCQNFIGQFFYWITDSLVYVKALKPTGFYAPSCIDETNRLYVSTHTGIVVYTQDFQIQDTLPADDHLIFGFFLNKTYHYFSQQQLYAYKEGKQHLLSDLNKRTPDFARTFSFVLNGCVYTYPKPVSSNRIYQVYPSFRVIELPVSLEGSGIQMISVTNDSLVWINTTSGTLVLDRLFKPIFPARLFPDYSISSVIADNEGNYWVSSTDGGLFIIESLNARVIQTTNEAMEGFAFTGQDNKLLVATNQGNIYQLNIGSGEKKLVVKLAQRNTVRSVAYDTTNKRIVVCNEGLMVYKAGRQLLHYKGAIKDVGFLPSGDLVFAATGLCGIVSFNRLKDLAQWKHKLKPVQKGNGYVVYVFTELSHALRNAAVLYHPDKDVFKVATSKGVYQLAPHAASSALQWHNETIIASRLLQCGNQVVVVSVNQGLLFEAEGKLVDYPWLTAVTGNRVLDSRVAGKGLYVLTDQGIFVADLTRKKVRPVYYTNNQEELLQFDVRGDRVFLLSGTGLKVIPLNNNITGKRPTLFVKGVWADGLLIKEGSDALSYLQNNIRIRFEVPWFQASSALKILYSINNQPWEQIQEGNRVLEFFSLSPGMYQVQMKAVTINGLESETRVCTFEIQQPFWRRWWFYVLLVGVSSALILLFYSYRIREIKLRNKLQEENYKLESSLKQSMLTSIKAQMNPHFVFNALNSIQSYIYLNDKQNASRFLAKFSSLTRKILEMSDEDDVSLEDELHALGLYLELEKMRFEDVFLYEIVVEEGIAPPHLRLPSMVIQPFVENAIKHGLLHKSGTRELHIRFSWKSPYLIVEIDDNGVGRAASAQINKQKQNEHKSFATRANQRRLDLLLQNDEKKVSVHYVDKVGSDGQAQGTKVILTILVE